MMEFSNTSLEEHIMSAGNNYPTSMTLKIPSIGWKIIFINSDGKISFHCRIFSSHATDGIFHHQKEIIPTDYGCPDGFFLQCTVSSQTK
jgi:hypothetical protein